MSDTFTHCRVVEDQGWHLVLVGPIFLFIIQFIYVALKFIMCSWMLTSIFDGMAQIVRNSQVGLLLLEIQVFISLLVSHRQYTLHLWWLASLVELKLQLFKMVYLSSMGLETTLLLIIWPECQGINCMKSWLNWRLTCNLPCTSIPWCLQNKDPVLIVDS